VKKDSLYPNPRARGPQTALCVIAFAIGPVSATLLPAMLGARGPSRAEAAPNPADRAGATIEIGVAVSRPSVPDANRQAEVSFARLVTAAIERHPFEREAATAAVDLPPDAPEEPELRLPVIELGTIMNGPSGAVASISGRLVRAGDRIDDQWRVGTIDAARRRVTFIHDAGAEHTVEMQSPLNQ